MKMKTYYYVEDEPSGQHGSFIEKVQMTRDKYLEVKRTGLLDGWKVFITDRYESALYYIQD